MYLNIKSFTFKLSKYVGYDFQHLDITEYRIFKPHHLLIYTMFENMKPKGICNTIFLYHLTRPITSFAIIRYLDKNNPIYAVNARFITKIEKYKA